MNPTHPRLSNGRYVVRRCIGTGGMGAVFLAYDDVLKGQRAIKVLKPELAAHPESRARFRTEAIAMAKLTHPGIVRVFDQGQEALTAFLVMEYLPAGSLQAALRSGGPLIREEALCVCLDVAEALDHAHRKGVIHRDIKPDNILLGDEGAKLTDFGLARVLNTDGGLTRSGATFGTPSFMPPEQRLDGKNTTARSDLYSLCATLFLLVTRENPIDLYERDARDRLLEGVDERIAAIVRTGCAADPSDRFEDAAALADALDAARDAPGARRTRPRAIPSETQGQTQDLATLNRLWRSFTTPNATAVPPADGENKTLAFFASEPPALPFQQGTHATQDDPRAVAPPAASAPPARSISVGRWTPLLATLVVCAGMGGMLVSRSTSPFPQAAPTAAEPDPAAGAWTALLRGAPFAAAEAAEAAAASRVTDPGLLAIRGVLAALKGQPEALQAAVQRAAASSPGDSAWSQALALADLHLAGDGTLAHQTLADRLLAWDTLLAPGEDARAEVLFLVSLHPHLSAAQLSQALQQARDRHPDAAVFAWLQVALQRDLRPPADQEALLTDALAAFPAVASLQTERGKLLLRRGELSVAQEVLTQASNLQPTDPEPHTLLMATAIRAGDEQAFLKHLSIATGDSASEDQQLAVLWQAGETFASVGQPKKARKIWHAKFNLSPDAVAMHRMRADLRGSRVATLLQAGGPEALASARTALADLSLPPDSAVPHHAALAYDAGVQAVHRGAPEAATEHLRALQTLAADAPLGSDPHELVALLELEVLLKGEGTGPQTLADALEQRGTALAGRCSGAWMAARAAARSADLTTLRDVQARLATADCRGPELETRLYAAEATLLLAEAAHAERDRAQAAAAQAAFAKLWPTPEELPLAQRAAELVDR